MYLSYAATALAVIGFLFNIFQSFVNINFGVIAIRYGFMGVTGFMGLAFDNAAIFQQIASMNAGYGTPEYSVPFSFYVLMLMAYIVMFIPPVSAVIGIVKAYRRRGGLVPFAVSAAGCFLMLITLRIIVSYISDMNRQAGFMVHSAVLYFIPVFWAIFYAGAAICVYFDKGISVMNIDGIKSSASSLAGGLQDKLKKGMTSAKIGMDIAASKVSELKKEYDSRKVEQLERDRADKFSNMTLKELIAEGLSALKESDFQRAEELFDHALATNPKNANAYIGKLMVKHKVRNANELVSVNVLIEEDELFQSAMKLANPKMKELLEKYVTVNRAKVSGKRLGKNS